VEPAGAREADTAVGCGGDDAVGDGPVQQGDHSKTEEADKKVVDRLGEVAERRGIPRATLALAWMLSKPVITSPIVGATKPNHLTDAVAALQVKLTAEEIASLEEPYVPHPVVGFS